MERRVTFGIPDPSAPPGLDSWNPAIQAWPGGPHPGAIFAAQQQQAAAAAAAAAAEVVRRRRRHLLIMRP